MNEAASRGATALFANERTAREAYLRSQGDERKAEAMMKEGAAWRKAFRPDLIRIDDVASVLSRYELYWHGIGSNGYRIAWLEKFNTHVAIEAAPDADNRAILDALAYIAETAVSPASPKVNVVLNTAGISKNQLDERLARLFIEAEALAFPDSLASLTIFGLPWTASLALHAINPLMPRYWRERVTFSRANASRALARVAGPGQLPQRHGGTAPDEEFSAAAFIAERRRVEAGMAASPRENASLLPFLYIQHQPWPADRVPDAVTSGFLKKRGGIITRWRNYFFVLRPGRLLWFKDVADTMPNGGIVLHPGISVRRANAQDDAKTSQRSRTLAIQSSIRTWLLAAKTQQERDRWITLLYGAISATA